MNVQRQGEVADLLETAREHRRRGDRTAALGAFQAAAKADQSNRAIEVAVAGELRALDRLDEAEALLRAILEKEPGSVGALIEQGHLARRRGDNDSALTAFEKAAEIEPGHLGLKVEVARSLRTLDRLEEAARILDGALAAEPQFLAALIEQGHTRRRNKDHSGALAAFEAAASAEPAHVGIQMEIASCLRALQRDVEAEGVLRGIAEASPKHLPALIGLGHLLIETGRFDEAEAVLQKAHALEHHDPRAPAALARIARLRDDRPSIIRHMKATIAADPRNFEARKALAAELRSQGDIAAAKAELHTLLEDRPDDAGSWVQLGLLYRADRDRPKAIASFEMAHAHQPGSAEPLIELAREKWVAGDPVEARKSVDAALALQPTHAGALALAAEWSLVAGKPEEALALAERAIDAQPRQVGFRLLAARAAAAVPDRAAADRHLSEARSAFGAVPDVLATEIHILRTFHDFAAVRGVIAKAGNKLADPALWIEGVSAAIAVGDFNAAERGLTNAPNASRQHKASGQFLRGQLAAAQRDYTRAATHYSEALDLDGANGSWEGELARAALLVLDTDAAEAHLRKSIDLGRSAALARGESLRTSQHHIGQLLDDFILDREVLTRLRNASAQPAAKRVAILKEIVRANPDSTAASLMLLLEMRRCGELNYVPKRFAGLMGARIPRRIVQFWDTEVVPPDIAALMATWRDQRNAFQYVSFNEASANAWLGANSPADVVRAFGRVTHPAQRADIFRLAYLAKEGGVYADADDRRVAPFDALLPKAATFVGYQEDYGTLGNNFLGAQADHPVIQRALGMVVAAINRGDADSIWLSTGPGLLTRAFAASLSQSDSRPWLERAMLREVHEMQALVEIHCPAAYKRTDRHWSVAAKQKAKPARRSKAR